jgi:DNA ligase-4
VIETPTLEAYHFLLPKFMAVQNNLQRAIRQVCQAEFAKRVPRHPKAKNMTRFLILANQCIEPEVGVKVGRGEFFKARSCQHVVDHAGGRMMYMERKYDGEYCQVHIDLSQQKSIRIFSKSGRDSTEDRIFIHRYICSPATMYASNKTQTPPRSPQAFRALLARLQPEMYP